MDPKDVGPHFLMVFYDGFERSIQSIRTHDYYPNDYIRVTHHTLPLLINRPTKPQNSVSC